MASAEVSLMRIDRLLACALYAALLSGCAATLDDPGRFLTDDGGSASCGAVEKTIIHARCGSCHGATNGTSSLDLASDGVLTRLANRKTLDGAHALVTPGNASESAIYTKVLSAPSFGSRMPLGTPLSDAEIACIKQWIEAP